MKDENKTKDQPINELVELRQRIAELEKSETKRKQAEEALRESEEKYRNIVETAPDGIVTVDLKGIVTSCNSAFTSITGFSESEIVGKHFSKLPTLRARNIPKYIKLFNSLIRGKVPKQFEARWLHKDGTAYWTEVRLSLMRRGRKIIGLQAIARDITERTLVEEALRESEGRFRDIAENALEWIWEVDAIGKYTYASPVVEKILGYKPEEVLKKHFYELFHPEDQEELKKAAFEVFAKKESFREFINRNVHKNRKTVWLSTSGVPILDEKGNLLGYRGADIDITERKRAEEEKARGQRLLLSLSQAAQAVQRARTPDEVYRTVGEEIA